MYTPAKQTLFITKKQMQSEIFFHASHPSEICTVNNSVFNHSGFAINIIVYPERKSFYKNPIAPAQEREVSHEEDGFFLQRI